ncbi:MAG: GTP-binding protein [Bacteroidales bacterium]|nr:GTP-binding protein [Bacteroidales bacterium]
MIKKKVSLIGAYAVGKTSLVRQFVYSQFSEKYLTTIGVKVDKKVVTVDDRDLMLMIWDIQGKDYFLDVPKQYIKGSAGFLLVMDGTRPETFSVAESLCQTTQELLGEVPFIALINKADLLQDWQIPHITIETLQNRGWHVLLTSARTGENVEEAFSVLAKKMML